nr:MAG TPA: 30S ribosomal protein S11 [Caudoviricetes sp.]
MTMAKSEKERYTRIVRAKSFDSYPFCPFC